MSLKQKEVISTEVELEDRITYLLSEWLNDAAPLGQERYRFPARAVIKEVREFLQAAVKQKPKRATRKKGAK